MQATMHVFAPDGASSICLSPANLRARYLAEIRHSKFLESSLTGVFIYFEASTELLGQDFGFASMEGPVASLGVSHGLPTPTNHSRQGRRVWERRRRSSALKGLDRV
jgi:hypothetical protein